MHSELYEVTATAAGFTLVVWVLSCSLFRYWLRDFSGETGTRKQCPSNIKRIVQEENYESGRSQPTPSLSSADDLLSRKKRRIRRRKRKRNLNASVAVENNVPVTPQDFRPRASSDNQLSTSRRRSYCCQELDLESQKDQPHVKAILQDHDWNTIATALVYLHKHNALERIARIVLKAIQHMQDLAAVPGRGYTKYMGYSLPNDYSETELRDIVLDRHGDMTIGEFKWVHREFVKSHGYPPTPYGFSKLYEKSIELETPKLRKRFDKLREKNDETEKRLEIEQRKLKEVQKENNLLKSRVIHLECSVARALCKICLVNEVAVLYQPCDHAVVCRSCHERSMAGKSKRARTCNICNCHIKTTKSLILA